MLISRGTTLSMIYKGNYIKSENQKNRGEKKPYKTEKKYNRRESGKSTLYYPLNFPMLPLKLAQM